MMTNEQTKDNIKAFMEREIPGLTPEDYTELEKSWFKRERVVEVAETYKVEDPEALASHIDRMKEPTAVVKPVPFTAPTSGAKKKFVDNLLLFLAIVVAGLMLILLFRSIADIQSDVADLQTDMQNLQTTTANLTKANNLLTSNVDEKAVTTNKLVEDTEKLLTRIEDMEASKANKTDLSRLANKTQLRRVERKLDAHLAIVATETTPMPVEEKPAVQTQTRNIRFHYQAVPMPTDKPVKSKP